MSLKTDDSEDGMKSAASQRICDLIFNYDLSRLHESQKGSQLQINYTPLIQSADGNFSAVNQLYGSISLQQGALTPEINQKIETLKKILTSFLPSYEVSVGGSDALQLGPNIDEIICYYHITPPTGIPSQLIALYFYPVQSQKRTQYNYIWDSLSRSQQLITSNVSSWVKKQAWEDLASKLRQVSGLPAQVTRGHKVFLSYKRRSKAEPVAETIANRLSQQNISVWFDKWEIKAGDSVPGKIGEGFKDGDACLVFLDHHYSSSDWCTTEMNTALTKAIDENFLVIPILVEDCDTPELLKERKPIYLKEPSADQFEQGLSEITDAIYKVDLNPYR